MTNPKTIMIDDEKYVREKDVCNPYPKGNRAVVVLDRGWVYAGDVEEKGNRLIIHNALWVFRWEAIGFSGMLLDPTSDKVKLRKMPYPVDMPASSEIYRVPVGESWGI